MFSLHYIFKTPLLVMYTVCPRTNAQTYIIHLSVAHFLPPSSCCLIVSNGLYSPLLFFLPSITNFPHFLFFSPFYSLLILASSSSMPSAPLPPRSGSCSILQPSPSLSCLLFLFHLLPPFLGLKSFPRALHPAAPSPIHHCLPPSSPSISDSSTYPFSFPFVWIPPRPPASRPSTPSVRPAPPAPPPRLVPAVRYRVACLSPFPCHSLLHLVLPSYPLPSPLPPLLAILLRVRQTRGSVPGVPTAAFS